MVFPEEEDDERRNASEY